MPIGGIVKNAVHIAGKFAGDMNISLHEDFSAEKGLFCITNLPGARKTHLH